MMYTMTIEHEMIVREGYAAINPSLIPQSKWITVLTAESDDLETLHHVAKSIDETRLKRPSVTIVDENGVRQRFSWGGPRDENHPMSKKLSDWNKKLKEIFPPVSEDEYNEGGE